MKQDDREALLWFLASAEPKREPHKPPGHNNDTFRCMTPMVYCARGSPLQHGRHVMQRLLVNSRSKVLDPRSWQLALDGDTTVDNAAQVVKL